MKRIGRHRLRSTRKPPLHERAMPPPARRRHGRHRRLHHLTLSEIMLTDDFRFLLPDHIEPDLAEKLRTLADDLEQIRVGGAPVAADLSKAPLMTEWRPVISPLGLRLMGFVAGHPRLGNTRVMTSQVWAAGPVGAWIRTLSRFYRLGLPLHYDAPRFKGGL